MAGLEELKRKLQPLFDSTNAPSVALSLDPCDSYTVSVSDDGNVNLLSRSYGVYNINEQGLQKRPAVIGSETETGEKTYCCASHEMHVFGTIGCGASSVVQRAIKVPIHRILALKRINVFEKEKRQQLLNEIRTLCEASNYSGLVEFHGAFYTPESGQISIALEYVDGGSFADILKFQKVIPEDVLSCMVKKLLDSLNYLHGVRRLVHRDIKPANLLVSLKGETKVTDFGVSAGLDNSVAMCATFVGTVTYMSPERIRNETYSFAADIWSLGLTILECGSGKFPYSANEGPANLMLQVNTISFSLVCCIFPHAYHLSNYFFFNDMLTICANSARICLYLLVMDLAEACISLSCLIFLCLRRSCMILHPHLQEIHFHQNFAHLSMLVFKRILMHDQQLSRQENLIFCF
ncbi:hypothetical protein ZIOFF_067470 [Zingiber officinale]|uniref:mitogen-activated protein kinase kinase n=1 Tax=Zingiber officinale TaxID=94328 RepID=A0A8J5EUP2_ZINOF|nr:hypothetical protein ZIOFF_067470 [Zingiber officinale]